MENTKDTIIIGIDIQNGFANKSQGGSLASEKAESIVPHIRDFFKKMLRRAYIFFTQDWHPIDRYHNIKEGEAFPKHCIAGTWDAEIVEQLQEFVTEKNVVKKETFGYLEWKEYLTAMVDMTNIKRIIVVGFASNICVISNLLRLRAEFPSLEIVFRADLSSGTTEFAHQAAIEIAKSCLIEVKEGD